jgi:hypothetical protein
MADDKLLCLTAKKSEVNRKTVAPPQLVQPCPGSNGEQRKDLRLLLQVRIGSGEGIASRRCIFVYPRSDRCMISRFLLIMHFHVLGITLSAPLSATSQTPIEDFHLTNPS